MFYKSGRLMNYDGYKLINQFSLQLCLAFFGNIMKILYIYPHPDDESFGPGHVMAKQVRDGHEVYLLTLTKGGATWQRFKYNHTIAEMGRCVTGKC